MHFPPFPKMLDFDHTKQKSEKLEERLWNMASTLNLQVVFHYSVAIRFSLHSCKSYRQNLGISVI